MCHAPSSGLLPDSQGHVWMARRQGLGRLSVPGSNGVGPLSHVAPPAVPAHCSPLHHMVPGTLTWNLKLWPFRYPLKGTLKDIQARVGWGGAGNTAVRGWSVLLLDAPWGRNRSRTRTRTGFSSGLHMYAEVGPHAACVQQRPFVYWRRGGGGGWSCTTPAAPRANPAPAPAAISDHVPVPGPSGPCHWRHTGRA